MAQEGVYQQIKPIIGKPARRRRGTVDDAARTLSPRMIPGYACCV
jgi:hypothetical protein